MRRLLVLAMLVAIVLPSSSVRAQDQCFPATGFCIAGRFAAYWQQNGGLAVFGYPITAAANEASRDTGQSYLTQWFERNRFELHTDTAAPYDVQLGRLGDDRLRQQGIQWQTLPRDNGPQTDCLWFAETKLNVCDQDPSDGTAQGGFMSYWRTEQLRDPRLNSYARSLALFGLPLTRARMETNSSGDTVLTQWFERARLEWHPNNPPGFRILLGLLGNELAAPHAARPPIQFVQNNALSQVDSSGKTQHLRDMPDMGKVLDAVMRGDEVVMLRGQGIQSVSAAAPATTIAT